MERWDRVDGGPGVDVMSFTALVERILDLPGPTRLVAVDGPGGAGKSTFAERLSRAAGGAPVVHTDDFASWDQALEWWPRLLEQVIEPLVDRRAGRYQRYDWEERRLAEWRTVEPSPIVVIEGASSARSEWSAHLAFVAWVETDRAERLRRGIERDGEAMRSEWEGWMAAEDRHFRGDPSRDRADLIVDGNPTVEHDPETSFVAIRQMAVRLRAAMPADQPLLERWDEDPGVVESGGEDGPWDWANELPRQEPWRELLIAELDGVPIGFLQLIDAREEETHYWGPDVAPGTWAIDIWIGAAEYRGRGFGSEMMRQALDRCFRFHGATSVLIDPLESNVRAHRFYERMGFRFVERRTFDSDRCRVYRLDRNVS